MGEEHLNTELELIRKYNEVNGKIIEKELAECRKILLRQKSAIKNEIGWMFLFIGVVCGVCVATRFL